MKTCIPCALVWPARLLLAFALAFTLLTTGCVFGDDDTTPGPDAAPVDWDAFTTDKPPPQCFPGPCPDAGP